ncbi:hypothetical protein QOZ80_1BG0059780 [Eleusine coracana subsp. coracana]|nr:hypothetical protein QOZ80_1BG0059750 [Eleusine coracana subsp. coracana]KAK3160463.1 hypothetical protein QOZ80_1BG0059780 [Eleusine coracana subsp. coracana]
MHPCCSEEKKLRKGLWSPEEDERLASHIARFGVSCWSSIPELTGLQRCGKSCRLRWMNYLRPDLKRGRFSQQEEDLIIALHKTLGNSWSQIATRLPGRSDNEIKNFWNARLRKKLRQKEASMAGSKDLAASRSRRCGEDDERKQPHPVMFNPLHAWGEDASVVGRAVVDATKVTDDAAFLADADRRNNAAAAELLTPSASSTSTSTGARGSDEDFLRAMVDDASYLFGDFYLDGSQDGLISFWEGHTFS